MADDKPNQPKRRVADAGFHTPSSCTSAASASPEVSLARPSGVSTQSGPWPQRDPQASPENSKRSSGLDYYAINATDETPGSCESSLMRPVDSKIDTTIRGRGDSDAKDPLDAPEPGIDPFDIQSASSSSIAPSFPSQTLPSFESVTGSGLTSSASLDSVRSVFSAISGSSATSSSSLSPPSRTRSSSRFMNPFTMIAGLIHRAGKWTRRLRLKKKHTPTGPATAHIANTDSAVDQPSPPAPTHASAAASAPVLHAVAAEEKSPLPDIPEELSVTLGSSIQSPAFSPKRSGRELNEDSGPQEQVPEELLNDSMLNSENDIIDMCHALSPASALPPLLLPTSASPPNSGPSSPVRPGEPNGDASSSGEDQPEGADAANAGFTGARVRNERRPFALEQLVHQSHQRRSSEGL